jgi:hypothetical protein
MNYAIVIPLIAALVCLSLLSVIFVLCCIKLYQHRMDALDEATMWEESAKEFSRNVDYYQSLIDLTAVHFGGDAFKCDDGTTSDSVLRAKIPEMVGQLKEQNTELKHRVKDLRERLFQIEMKDAEWPKKTEGRT